MYGDEPEVQQDAQQDGCKTPARAACNKHSRTASKSLCPRLSTAAVPRSCRTEGKALISSQLHICQSFEGFIVIAAWAHESILICWPPFNVVRVAPHTRHQDVKAAMMLPKAFPSHSQSIRCESVNIRLSSCCRCSRGEACIEDLLRWAVPTELVIIMAAKSYRMCVQMHAYVCMLTYLCSCSHLHCAIDRLCSLPPALSARKGIVL